eukprot:CAMPEP_0170183526 /NCGR_PEP_ID=MMETSP0040_2-20121228/30971_1 /TAXON_ID=641309 /ORGANISM="Lotharella oceanica, Strain CCMP622" /LENGTH=69 /DNA_ID=CAMNT_0010429293 /DNA_START=213 /DNA_END=422 /DNA_ORIENTATION=+
MTPSAIMSSPQGWQNMADITPSPSRCPPTGDDDDDDGEGLDDNPEIDDAQDVSPAMVVTSPLGFTFRTR